MQCPYTVSVSNRSSKGNFAALYVDGQKVGELALFCDYLRLATSSGLLFILPFPSLRTMGRILSHVSCDCDDIVSHSVVPSGVKYGT